MIISASRRTDIPAFYTSWLMNRINEGFLLTRNPFNAHQVKRISLLPADVDIIVFWTRNAKMLIPHLQTLDKMGYQYYFQYTVTGYPREIEKSVPRLHHAVETFKKLSDFVGKEKIIWRYDPLLVSNLVNISDHKKLFLSIASSLVGKTNKVVISFADLYGKSERNLNRVDGLKYIDIISYPDQLHNLVSYMYKVASDCGMEIETCAEGIDISQFGVRHGKCIDAEYIYKTFDIRVDNIKDSNQREDCGCIKSVDIGTYNTCRHGCQYCYATYSDKSVSHNIVKHIPTSPFLIGNADDVSPHLLIPESQIIQSSLF